VNTRASARPSLGSISLDALLSVHSDDLLGPAREPRDDSDEIGFSVYSRPGNETIVTLSQTCDLRTVFNRCREIEAAILDNGDPRVTFTRDEQEGAYRLDQFGRTHVRSVCNVCAELAAPSYALALNLVKDTVRTAHESAGPITAYQLFSDRTTDLLGPAREHLTDSEPDGFSVLLLPNGAVIVTLLPACDLCEVLLECRAIIGHLLEWDNEDFEFTRDHDQAPRRLAQYAQGRTPDEVG